MSTKLISIHCQVSKSIWCSVFGTFLHWRPIPRCEPTINQSRMAKKKSTTNVHNFWMLTFWVMLALYTRTRINNFYCGARASIEPLRVERKKKWQVADGAASHTHRSAKCRYIIVNEIESTIVRFFYFFFIFIAACVHFIACARSLSAAPPNMVGLLVFCCLRWCARRHLRKRAHV